MHKFLILIFIHYVKATPTVVVQNTVNDFYGLESQQTVLQSFGANDTTMSLYYYGSNPDYRTLYYYVYDTYNIDWDPNSTECTLPALANGDFYGSVVSTIVSSEGFDANGFNCTVQQKTLLGNPWFQYVCCYVENLGYMPAYQYLGDDHDTYHSNLTTLIPFTGVNDTFTDEPRQCCNQELYDAGSTTCGCTVGDCCKAGEWCESNGVINFFCGVIAEPNTDPTNAPTSFTPYPSRSPTSFPTSSPTLPTMSPTNSPTTSPTQLPTSTNEWLVTFLAILGSCTVILIIIRLYFLSPSSRGWSKA